MASNNGEYAPAGLREIGHLACWNVTSAKPGNGVDVLRDGRIDTFWQSDGLLPHIISIQWDRRMDVAEVHFYLDYKLDESYTPNKISIQSGASHQDVKELKVLELEEPSGWVACSVETQIEPSSEASGPVTLQLQTHLLQISVIGNYQNGRDSHIRQVKVFSRATDPLQTLLGTPLPVTTSEMAMFATIR